MKIKWRSIFWTVGRCLIFLAAALKRILELQYNPFRYEKFLGYFKTELLLKASQLKRSMATSINDLKTQYDVCITKVNFLAILQWKHYQIISL